MQSSPPGGERFPGTATTELTEIGLLNQSTDATGSEVVQEVSRPSDDQRRSTVSFPQTATELAGMYGRLFPKKPERQSDSSDAELIDRFDALFEIADVDETGVISEENARAINLGPGAPLLVSLAKQRGTDRDKKMVQLFEEGKKPIVGMNKEEFQQYLLGVQEICNTANTELFPFILAFMEAQIPQSAGQYYTNKRAMLDPGSEKFDLGEHLLERSATVGGAFPGITVCMKDLRFEAVKREFEEKTVLSSLACGKDSDEKFLIFEKLDAVCRSGEMTLIIGPPGSGKSTLLKAISGRYEKHADGAGKILGDLRYNGNVMNPDLEIFVNLILPYDEHLPLLSVSDTFQFVHDNTIATDQSDMHEFLLRRCFILEAEKRGFTEQERVDLLSVLQTKDSAQWATSLDWMPKEQAEEFAEAVLVRSQGATETWSGEMSQLVEIVLRVLRLTHVRDTCVGNTFIRGVSGGERRRVSFGEAVLKKVSLMCCDEITNGLDANSALALTQAMRSAANQLNNTYISSLLQPSLDIYQCYDRVVMMNKGKVVYSGKRVCICQEVMKRIHHGETVVTNVGDPQDRVLVYFDSIGLAKPAFLPTPDFLDQVTGGSAQTKRFNDEWMTQHGEKWTTVNGLVPSTAEEFAAAWTKSEYASENHEEVQVELAKEAVGFEQAQVLAHKVPYWTHLKSVTARQWKYIMTDGAAVRQGIVQTLFIAFLAGTLFLGLDDTFAGGQSRAGLIFFINTNIVFSTFALLPAIIAQRNVFYKQKRMAIVETSAFMFSMTISAIPVDSIKSVVFASIVYWLVGFQADVGKFGFFVLLVWTLSFAANQMTRMVASAAPSVALAQAVGPISTIVMMAFSGYLISVDNMKPWAVWIYYISPIHYAFEALMINELKGLAYNCAAPVAQSCPSFVDGDSELTYYGYSTNEEQKWIDLGILGGFLLLFLIGTYLSLEYIRYDIVATGGVKPAPAREKTATKKPLPLLEQNNQVALSFSDLTYDVLIPTDDGSGTKQLRLLQQCFGYFVPNTATCLMGSSGAGKTTLMDVIAGMKTGGTIGGNIWVNHKELLIPNKSGKLVPSPSFRRYVGYVEQSDIHLVTLTVREAFQFSADTRLPTHTQEPHNVALTPEDRLQMVEYTLDMLELQDCADVQISLLDSQQLKRCTMGVELVADPAILFLDEPTSGLDSIGALTVMESIKNVAAAGVTVVCTIHQPSETLFNYFDNLLLLKRGGYQVYFGPCPKRNIGEDTVSSLAFDYFQNLRDAPKWGGNNPADYLLDFCDATKNFDQQYAGSTVGLKLNSWINGTANTPAHKYYAKRSLPEYATEYALKTCSQLSVVIKRAQSDFWRSPDYNTTRMLTAVFTSCFLGLMMYPRVSTDTTAGCNNRVSALFLAVVVQVTNVMQSMTPIFKQRAVRFRERQSKCYNEFVYFLSTFLVEIPYVFVSTSVFTWILFFSVGLNTESDRIVYYALMLIVYNTFSIALGQFVASLSPTQQVGAQIAPGMTTLFVLNAGFLIIPSEIPAYWKWIYWISPLHYALEGLVSNELGGRECGSAMGGPTGDQLLDSLDMNIDNRWRDMLVLFVAFLVLRIFTFVNLTNIEHIKR